METRQLLWYSVISTLEVQMSPGHCGTGKVCQHAVKSLAGLAGTIGIHVLLALKLRVDTTAAGRLEICLAKLLKQQLREVQSVGA